MLTHAEIRTIVIEKILFVLAENDPGSCVPEITDLSALADLGMSSLGLAQLLVTLESEFGADPFAEDEVFSDMRTVDDLVQAYLRAASVPVSL